jgi:hypothetical protein
MPRYIYVQTHRIVRSLPDRPDRLEAAEFEAWWKKAERIAFEQLEAQQT